MLAADADLMSVGNCASGIEKLAYLEIGVNQDTSRDPMSHSPRSRRDCGHRGKTTLEDEGSVQQTVALPGRRGWNVTPSPILGPIFDSKYELSAATFRSQKLMKINSL